MLEDIAILTGGKAISEDLGIKLENVKLEDLGRAKKLGRRQGQHHDRRGRRQAEDDPGPHRADPARDRRDHLRLRPGEAPGAAREARRRRRRDQGRRGHRDRDEGEEGPRRGRAPRDPRRGRGRASCRAAAWRCSAPPGLDDLKLTGRRGDRRGHRPARARGAAPADRARTPGSRARWSSRRSRRQVPSHGLRRRHQRVHGHDEGRASSTRPRSSGSRCRTRRRSRPCCSPPRRSSPRSRRRRRPAPSMPHGGDF